MDRSRRAELLDRYERLSEVPMLVLALAVVFLFVLPYLVDLPATVDSAAGRSFWLVIYPVFAVDLGIKTYLSERRLPYLVSHWYDVLIVAIPFLRPLRVLRSARGLRALRISRLLPFMARFGAEIRNLGKRRGLQWILLAGVAAVFASATLVFEFERGEGGSIDDFWTAMWWAMSTITTVGYGDATPVSPEGRGVAVFLMVVGISFFSWVTANIAAFLVESPTEGEAVTTADLMRKLESLEAEIKSLRRPPESQAKI